MEAAPGILGTPLADLGVRTPALVRGEVRVDVTVVTASAPVWLTRDGIGGGTDFLFRLWLPFTLLVAVVSQVWSLFQSYFVGFSQARKSSIIVSPSTIDKMFEIYTIFENTTEIYTFFEKRTEIYTFL